MAIAKNHLIRGELEKAGDESRRGYIEFGASNPEWACRFKTLQAQTLLEQGLFEGVLQLLGSDALPCVTSPDLAISILTLSGIAEIRLHKLPKAETDLNKALGLCGKPYASSCGDLFQALGLLASERSQSAIAEKMFEMSLSFARAQHDGFLESNSLLNLGFEYLQQEQFDKTIDRSQAAYESAEAIGARIIELVSQGNVGWAYYRLGDSEQALKLSLEAEKAARQLKDVFDQENELTNLGYIYLDRHELDRANASFQQALEIAQAIKAQQDVYNVLRVLARLSLQRSNADSADEYSREALQIAREGGNHLNELYPLLVLGQVAALRGDAAEAQRIYETVRNDPVRPVFLKWEAQHYLAQLYEDEKKPDAAEREYHAALATFESARNTVRHEDFKLSFLTNAARIYDDYVHFLIARGMPDEALRWADYSRARTLSEGLGLLSKGVQGERAAPAALRAREIARRARGTILFYWLGEKQSYLWAVAPHKTDLYTLPPGAEIDALVGRYREELGESQDVLASSEEARTLYRTLIAPARGLLAKDARVYVIPDGSLNNLNFETLVVSDSRTNQNAGSATQPHFFIEDADVINASSLRVLNASFSRGGLRGENRARRLLLIGNSVSPGREFPELPKAGEQMAKVARHFPDNPQICERERATPEAYLAGHPEEFSNIHFVAHGLASRLSPLDSSIVLSRNPADKDAFKLHAREIIQRPLRADLVTISACSGAGERSYSGEGLVGLAWAFLRAGAHNVIAGLWDVADAPTEQLMDRFYDELDKGVGPDKALRTAKLSLLYGGMYGNPFYWAPFQLYTGS